MKRFLLIAATAFFALFPANAQELQYGRKVTDFTTGPKFGGFFVGKYTYTDQDGKNNGDGLSQRMARVYVDGTILTDFKYRVQVQ